MKKLKTCTTDCIRKIELVFPDVYSPEELQDLPNSLTGFTPTKRLTNDMSHVVCDPHYGYIVYKAYSKMTGAAPARPTLRSDSGGDRVRELEAVVADRDAQIRRLLDEVRSAEIEKQKMVMFYEGVEATNRDLTNKLRLS